MEKKNICLTIRQTAWSRIQELGSQFKGKESGVIIKALQLFDFMFREHEKGTVFLVKRPDRDIEVLKVFK